MRTGLGIDLNIKPFICAGNIDVFVFSIPTSGTVEVLSYPSLQRVDTLMAHTAGCYCIAIDPLGRCAQNLSYRLAAI